MKLFQPEGPRDAKIVIIGEALGEQEEYTGKPFVGNSGQELTRMLAEAGINRQDCYLTNVFWFRPPDNKLDNFFTNKKKEGRELVAKSGWIERNGLFLAPVLSSHLLRLNAELSCLRPNVIIALGNWAQFALTGEWSVDKWRGSIELTEYGYAIATYHPANVLRNWENRHVVVHDMRRAALEVAQPDFTFPVRSFVIRPSFETTIQHLTLLQELVELGPTKLSVDIETRAGHMACVGIAWSKHQAICVPLLCTERDAGYWTLAEELVIVRLLRAMLTHDNCRVIGQNHMYDLQYTLKEWACLYDTWFDTMIAQAVAFPGRPKALDYIASMYCRGYQYWKGEGKEWTARMDEEVLWVYNCKDCCFTYEAQEELDKVLTAFSLQEQFRFINNEVTPIAIEMCVRGVRHNPKAKVEADAELVEGIEARIKFIQDVVGYNINVGSPKQMMELFYEQLHLPIQKAKKTKRPTADDDALKKLAEIQPLVHPLVEAINEARSMGVFLKTFVRQKLGIDGRSHTSYNTVGAETFRWNSGKDVFGSGTNWQNVPAGNRNKLLPMPNCRKLCLADSGKRIWEIDQAGADAQVVAAEAGDPILKQMFRERVKIHAENAKAIFGRLAGPDGKTEPYYTYAKQGCHAYNYGAMPRTVAIALGILMKEAEQFQHRWFTVHPWIPDWHKRVTNDLETTRSVRNRFGYRRYFFDRIHSILGEALAWVPQSTVAICTNQAIVNIRRNVREVMILLNGHDSIVGQTDNRIWHEVKPRLKTASRVIIPYDDPLIIPFDLKSSTTSWGDCESESW